jgi:hypothetical protein
MAMPEGMESCPSPDPELPKARMKLPLLVNRWTRLLPWGVQNGLVQHTQRINLPVGRRVCKPLFGGGCCEAASLALSIPRLTNPLASPPHRVHNEHVAVGGNGHAKGGAEKSGVRAICAPRGKRGAS